MPTTWAVLPDEEQPVLGTKRCGLLSLDLSADGAAHHEPVVPDGLSQLTLQRDIPSPYGH